MTAPIATPGARATEAYLIHVAVCRARAQQMVCSTCRELGARVRVLAEQAAERAAQPVGVGVA